MSTPQITMDQTIDNSRTNNVFALEQAAKCLEKCLVKDNSAPSLVDQISINVQGGASASGLTDHDYPILNGLPATLIHKTQMKTLSKVPLPPEIMEHFNHMQCHCMMGLFTEINRAWLTIDSDIYVWTYEDGGDVAYYDGLNETIISVGLVKPRNGVFHSFIKYLLVLTTSVDIIVLGVTFSSGDAEGIDEIQLVSDPVFTIPTDGTTITFIVGTNNGRLFLGSKDGCLYEISYQAESSWFGKRCKKINHSMSKLAFLVPSFAYAAIADEDGIVQIVIDDTRHILYMLTEKGAIEVYDMGVNGTSFGKITKVSQNNIVHQAVQAVKTLDSQNFRPIISISAIELNESSCINLVAITQSGVRLYFSTMSVSQMISNPNQRPYTLALQHVRLPPGFSANTHLRPRNIHAANYRERNVVMVSNMNEKDTLWCISSDLFPFSQYLMEACTNIDLDGPALAMAEVRCDTNMLLQPTQQIPPLVVRQHSEEPRKYVVLTAQGAHIFMKMRPVDLFKQLLLDTRGQDTDALKVFFQIQQEDQACATSLILASMDNPQTQDVSDFAANAFFVFGGEPKLAQLANINNTINQTGPYGTSMFLPNMMSTPMPQQHTFNQQNITNPNMSFSTPQQYPNLKQPYPNLQQQYQQQTMPISPGNPHPLTQSIMFDINSPFVFSSKHNGLYLYMARILRPLWNLRCVEKMTLDGKKFYLTSTVSSEECSCILSHLNSLCVFLKRNTQLSICNNSTIVNQTLNVSLNQTPHPNQMVRANYTLQDAQLEERQSLDALKAFVSHASQVLGLWKILCEHQFHVLMDALEDGHQQVMQNTTFKDVLLYGHDVCATLINTLINSYLGDNASVDSISSKLRDVCPNLYKTEDAACSKANEILKAAKAVSNLNEKDELLIKALSLCKSVAPNVNLQEICQQFAAQNSYHAVTDLCTTCAKRLDPDNIGEHFYKNGEQNDQEGYQFYAKRMEVYKEVVAMLDRLYSQNDGSQNISNINGQIVGSPMEGPQGSNNITRQVILDVLKFRDELLHIAVYEWMMSKQMNGELITISELSLETYLLKASQHNPNNVPIMDLLWKYYESNNNHASAAKILSTLASINSGNLTLKDRLSYLARSIMCMRSDKVGYAPYLGVFLRELEDKLDIAKVQEQILVAVVAMKGSHPEIDIAEQYLNNNLYDITQLYEDFADKFNLWECKLAIIDCAGYTDAALVRTIWKNILENEKSRSTAVGNDKMVQVISKVRLLSRMYRATNTCFPLDYLVDELEYISAELKAETSLVPNFFVSQDIKIDVLIKVYNNAMIVSLKDNFWSTEENEFHFSEAIAAIINAFVYNQDNYNNIEKRKLIALSQDTVAGLLSNLYSKPHAGNVIALLRNIQAKLSKM